MTTIGGQHMSVDSYAAAIAVDSALLAAAATDLDRPVPAVPGWSAGDLLAHAAASQAWMTAIVAAPADVAPPRPDVPARADALDFFEAATAALLGALAAADPHQPLWSPRRRVSSLYWARRAAHSTALHRVDAEQAAGCGVYPAGELFAADAVAETVELFVPAGHGGVLLHAEGTAWSWIAPEGAPVRAVVEGSAEALWLWLWGRGDDVVITGDAVTAAAVRAAVAAAGVC